MGGTATGTDRDGGYEGRSEYASVRGSKRFNEGLNVDLQLLTTIPEPVAVADPELAEAPSVLVSVGAT